MARVRARNGNGRRLTTQQSVNAAVKSICDIMRRSNCAGALQYVPELTWILFLRILDEREQREAEEAEASEQNSRPRWTPPTAGGTGPIPVGRSAVTWVRPRWGRCSRSSSRSCCRISSGSRTSPGRLRGRR